MHINVSVMDALRHPHSKSTSPIYNKLAVIANDIYKT
jgi:hypothetical protein